MKSLGLAVLIGILVFYGSIMSRDAIADIWRTWRSRRGK
jgi:hypothetical protein